MKQLGRSAGAPLGGTGEIQRLQELLLGEGLAPLDSAAIASFDKYLNLILRWNARTNLTGIRDAEGILRRHFLESISSAQALPAWIDTLLDFGSGAGFPGIPIAICRPKIGVTLAESQSKKAGFLQEVVSVLRLKAIVFRGRAETLSEHFDCVIMRAVDQMQKAVVDAASLVRSGGLLALMTTSAEFPGLERSLNELIWQDPIPLPGSDRRVLCFGRKDAV